MTPIRFIREILRKKRKQMLYTLLFYELMTFIAIALSYKFQLDNYRLACAVILSHIIAITVAGTMNNDVDDNIKMEANDRLLMENYNLIRSLESEKLISPEEMKPLMDAYKLYRLKHPENKTQ